MREESAAPARPFEPQAIAAALRALL